MNDTQVDHSTCAASGCPMLSTHNRSGNGEGAWLCFIHFAAEPGDRQRLTNELARLQWLVAIVRQLRARAAPTADQQQSFVLAQRSDLKQRDSETPQQWMIRLESVLQKSCKDSLVTP